MMALLNAGHTQSWDEAGMMKQSVVPAGSPVGVAGTNEYGYDVDRKRSWKKITRNSSIVEHAVYIHAGPNLIAEYPAGTAAASPAQEYVYAQEIDSLVMLVRSTGGGSGNEKLAITRNQQWSETALTDATSGTVLERYTYDHFGKRTILEANGTTVRATSSYNMPFGYTSRQHDSETGLMYFRARYFDPHSAEFTSPDPLEYVDGMRLFRGYFVPVVGDPFGLAISLESYTQCMRKCISDNSTADSEPEQVVKFCKDFCKFKPNNCHAFTCEQPGNFPNDGKDSTLTCRRDPKSLVPLVSSTVIGVRDSLSRMNCTYAGKNDCSKKKGCVKLYLEKLPPAGGSTLTTGTLTGTATTIMRPPIRDCYYAYHSAKIDCGTGTCKHIPGQGGNETDEGDGFAGPDEKYKGFDAAEFWECPCPQKK